MSKSYDVRIAEELKLTTEKVEATVRLLDDGASVPFISRYRKEVTGNLDEVAITNIRDRLHQLRELDKRRATVLHSIKEQDKLTEALKEQITSAQTLAVLEDLYLPYRPKRRTKGTVAKEQGLEPLAKKIFAQTGITPDAEAVEFVNAQKGIESTDDALAGARHIIAEWINEDTKIRAQLRKLFYDKGVIASRVIRGKEQEGNKYKDYFQWEELARNAPSHRILDAFVNNPDKPKHNQIAEQNDKNGFHELFL